LARCLAPATCRYVALDHMFDHEGAGDAVASQDCRRCGAMIDQKRQKKAGAVAGHLGLETLGPLHRALQWIVRGLALRDARKQPIDFPADDVGIGAAGYQRRDGIGITGQGEQ
jgi:hypothetical protein